MCECLYMGLRVCVTCEMSEWKLWGGSLQRCERACASQNELTGWVRWAETAHRAQNHHHHPTTPTKCCYRNSNTLGRRTATHCCSIQHQIHTSSATYEYVYVHILLSVSLHCALLPTRFRLCAHNNGSRLIWSRTHATLKLCLLCDVLLGWRAWYIGWMVRMEAQLLKVFLHGELELEVGRQY